MRGRRDFQDWFYCREAGTAPGFTTEDILWAVGIWSVILTLAPVIVFYLLMVA